MFFTSYSLFVMLVRLFAEGFLFFFFSFSFFSFFFGVGGGEIRKGSLPAIHNPGKIVCGMFSLVFSFFFFFSGGDQKNMFTSYS